MPEWLPEYRRIEVQWMDKIRKVYEGFGYMPIETPAIELLETLRAKGDIDKEIYVVKKLHEGSKEEFGLHYDLTVPFARYVAQHYGDLSFPFRRYQMQKIWRGERPQKGRYREFYQCDIDVIDNDSLHIYFDFEVLFAGQQAMRALGIPDFLIGVSNRKIYEGYVEALGIEDTAPVLRIIDKMDKVGPEGVSKMLREEIGLSEEVIEKALLPAEIKSADLSFVEQFKALGISNEKADQGIEELAQVIRDVQLAGGTQIQADLSFVRGFDYYTGTIFEGKFLHDPSLGSICSGGRYENLTGRFTNKELPGVGFSIGLSRIFGILIEEGHIQPERSNVVDAIILRTHETDQGPVLRTAQQLRARGLKIEVYSHVAKLGKQFKYVQKREIPYAWISTKEDAEKFEVKNMETGEQGPADPATWLP